MTSVVTATTTPPKNRRFASASLSTGVALICVAIYFFLASVTLISPPTQAVVSALLSAIIGFATLATGAGLIRTYVVARIVETRSDQ